MPSLFRLVYVSKATAPPTRDDLAAILRVSRTRNSREGVTGVLFHREGAYAGLLEGPISDVERTFWRIEQDTRHTDVTVVLREPINTRCSPARPLGFFDLDRMSDAKRASLGVHPRHGFGSVKASDVRLVRDLVHAFRTVWQEADA